MSEMERWTWKYNEEIATIYFDGISCAAAFDELGAAEIVKTLNANDQKDATIKELREALTKADELADKTDFSVRVGGKPYDTLVVEGLNAYRRARSAVSLVTEGEK